MFKLSAESYRRCAKKTAGGAGVARKDPAHPAFRRGGARPAVRARVGQPRGFNTPERSPPGLLFYPRHLDKNSILVFIESQNRLG